MEFVVDCWWFVGPLNALHLIFCQIVADVYGLTPCIRLTPNEKRAGVNMLSGYGVTAENYNSSHRANIKRNVIELARTWPLYFSRLFPVSGAAQVPFCLIDNWQYNKKKCFVAFRGWAGRSVALGCPPSKARAKPLTSDQIFSSERHQLLHRSQTYHGEPRWSSRPGHSSHAPSSADFWDGHQVLPGV